MKVVFYVFFLNSFKMFYAVFNERISLDLLLDFFFRNGVIWKREDLIERVNIFDIFFVG